MRIPLKSASSSSQGFSLVEMLVVISVIGIIASIAIPSIGSINASAKTATRQRNAQSIVSMFAAGGAAGVSWSGTTRNELVGSVVSGQAPTDGAFSGKTFRVPNITGTALTDTYPYIGKDSDGTLFYDQAGGQPAS
jgi:prepilin-type N-terminal cleavage/methylation domain-containing protein